jgi:hypothetical protein
MANLQFSTKRVAINRSNAQLVIIVGVASFITVFCLVASASIWSQNKYQARVTKEKTVARVQLQKNLKAYADLSAAYNTFNAAPTNVIGGNSSGTGDNDGNNSKIILDALPSSYDFPALATSIEKILADNNLTVGSISGTDDQVNQGSNVLSDNPQAVPIPFSFSVTNSNYVDVIKLLSKLESSIRPISIDSISMTGSNSSMEVSIQAHTYYQPGKSLSITKKVVK